VIRYALAEPTHVRLLVYDVSGQLVCTLVDERQGRGLHEVAWYATNESGGRVAGGVYFYRMAAGNRAESRRTVFVE
jgi:flagellar hook assembly protein FlgD